jgi:hypothetical protein
LNEYLFDILKKLPNDGTFDQYASVKRCFIKSKEMNCSYGFDLSAATDRLPVILQSKVIDTFSLNLGRLWTKLLVDRDYHILTGSAAGVYRYSVGQPMGALSS